MDEDDKAQAEGCGATEEERYKALHQLYEKVGELSARVQEHETRLKKLEGARLEAVPTEETCEETSPDQKPEQTLEERARAVGVDYAKLRHFYSEEELRELLTKTEPPLR